MKKITPQIYCFYLQLKCQMQEITWQRVRWRKHRCLIHKLQKQYKGDHLGRTGWLNFPMSLPSAPLFFFQTPHPDLENACYIHFILNINAGRPNYVKHINITKDRVRCILLNLRSAFFLKVLFQVVVLCQLFSHSINSYTFTDIPASTDRHCSKNKRFFENDCSPESPEDRLLSMSRREHGNLALQSWSGHHRWPSILQEGWQS